MKTDKLPKVNIFQNNTFIRETIADSLGYEKYQKRSTYTQDIYFQTYFYITKRFGFPMIVDDYKKISVWNFEVKNYTITIEMNSSWVIFMVFGDEKLFSKATIPPSWIRYSRVSNLKKNSLIINLEDASKRSIYESEKIQTLLDEFQKDHNIPDDITPDEFNDQFGYEFWYTKISEFNNSIIGINHSDFAEKHGYIYYNSNTKHALKTLRQFLYNMQTPIYIRDVPYNIKGQMSDSDASWFSRYENNVAIEFLKS